MNIFEVSIFIGLPSIVAFIFLLGTPDSFERALGIGCGSAFVSLFAVIIYCFVFRRIRGRPIQKAPVPIWAAVAVLLSMSLALYFRSHHL